MRTDGEILEDLLAAMATIEPPTGYLSIGTSDAIVEVDGEYVGVPAVGIDGWMFRSDLERVVGEVFRRV